jgi:hypothetical protein
MLLIRASHDEFQLRVVSGNLGKGIDKKVAPFFPMNPAKEEKKALAQDLWALFVEGLF